MKGAIHLNRDRYDAFHFLAILFITIVQVILGFNDVIFFIAISFYALLAIVFIEKIDKYSISKFIILISLVMILKTFITIYS